MGDGALDPWRAVEIQQGEKPTSAGEGEHGEAGDCKLPSLGLCLGGGRNGPVQGHRHGPHQPAQVAAAPRCGLCFHGRRERLLPRRAAARTPAPFAARLAWKE